MIMLKNSNLLLIFLIELAALGILGYWGFKTGTTTTMKYLLGIISPLSFAIFWGLFLAPKANFPLHPILAYSIKFAIFLLVSYALFHTGRILMATSYLVITYISLLFTTIWKQ